jgi:predicted CXXCH cytochrome family protein
MAVALSAPRAEAQTGIVNTRHNLSVSGPGTIKATSEDRICIFCHAPHNASPQTPLWNKNIEGINYSDYTPYTSSTMANPYASQVRPTGASRLCLSCHDGTLALGDVLRPSQGIAMTVPGGIPSSLPSHLGTSLANHHPVSFSYYDSLSGNPQLFPALPQGLIFYGNGVIECSTCHDAHDNTNKKFLAKSNENSELCTLCHVMYGWDDSPHKTSESVWNGTAPYPWPRTGAAREGYNAEFDFGWTTVRQNGCENCHAPHAAAGQARLLNCFEGGGECSTFTNEGTCHACHNGNLTPPPKDIISQMDKPSSHRASAQSTQHDPTETVPVSGHVECVDCHNPHMANNAKTYSVPEASGRLEGVSGMTAQGASVNPAKNEYELCFKCHASASAQVGSLGFPVQRWNSTDDNTRLEFQTSNASYHPVVGIGASSNVPSLRAEVLPSGTNSLIYCTDCHSDEGVEDQGSGSRGPHGSQYPPILKNRYKTAYDNAEYSTGDFRLCYNCHNETVILPLDDSGSPFPSMDGSRGGHVGHVKNVRAPCSACHDPHGVASNNRLINFDRQYVSGLTGPASPVFSGGNGSGSCSLVCHLSSSATFTHDQTVYP